MRSTLLLLGWSTAAGCGPSREPAIIRTELAPPEDTASAFEPFVIIDPARPNRVIVGAQYGAGYNRAGRGIWNWASQDGGRTWRTSRVLPKPFPSAGQALAADLTMAAGPDGTIYHLSLTADSSEAGLRSAAAALAVSADGGVGFSPRLVFGTVEQPAPDVLVFTDKSWVAADHGEASPHRGKVYFGWSRNRVVFGARDTTVSSSPAVATSADGGRSITAPVALADSGFGLELAVSPNGALHAIWAGDERLILHRRSLDGGRTFDPPHIVATADSGRVLELPRLAVGASGTLLVCWTESSSQEEGSAMVRCAGSVDGSTWSSPFEPTLSGGAVLSYPAVAATSRGFWLLVYAGSADSVKVYLMGLTGQWKLAPVLSLAARPLPAGGFCPRPGASCRRTGRGFFPGDYVTLAGAGDRLAAAFTLPRSGSPEATSIVVVVIDRPEVANPARPNVTPDRSP